MAASLFDQLKKSGLVSEKQAKQAQRDRQQQAKQKNANKAKKGESQLSDSALLAAKAAEEKVLRDRELNQQRQQELQEKAKQAELKQLIEHNRLTHFQGEIAYHFADANAVKTLHINAATQKSLAQDQLLIVRFNGGYALVNADLKEKISQRDASAIVVKPNLASKLSEEDEDYYAKFAIPDDLIW